MIDWLSGEIYQNYIDPISTYIGLATFIISIGIFFRLEFFQRRYFAKLRKEAMQSTGDKPAGLVVDYIGKGAFVEASQFLKNELSFGEENQIINIGPQGNKPPKDISSSDVPDLVKEIQGKIYELSQVGADKIYLFVAAPTPIVLIVGAELANFGNIYLMHKNKGTSSYEHWGPLRLPRL